MFKTMAADDFTSQEHQQSWYWPSFPEYFQNPSYTLDK